MPRKSHNSNKNNNNLNNNNSNSTNSVPSSSSVLNMDFPQSHAISVNSNSQDNSTNSSSSMPPLIPICNTDFAVPPRHTLSRLPRFSGKPTELNFFISTCKSYASINNISDKQLLFELSQSLDDQAKQLFAEHQEYDPITSSENFFQFLTQHFATEDSSIHKQNFDKLHMLENESIRNLTHRINFLTKKAFPEISDPIALNRIKCDKFWDVIPISLKQQIHFSNKSKNFEDIVQAATDAESFLLEIQHSSSSNSTALQTINSLQTQQNSTKNNSITQSFHNSNSKHQAKFKTKGRICQPSHQQHVRVKYYNNKPQHSYNPSQRQSSRYYKKTRQFPPHRFQHNPKNNSKFYPLPQTSTYSNVTQSIVPVNDSNNVICQICETPGHSAKDCSHAKIWFNLKETLMSNATNSANTAPVVTFPPNEFVTH